MQRLLRNSFACFSKYYSKSHEWIAPASAGLYNVGISDHAQNSLGGVVHLAFNPKNKAYEAGKEVAEIESSKAVAQIYAPVALEIKETNDNLIADLNQINDKAEDTWILRVKVKNEADLKALMNQNQYEEFLKTQ